MIFISIMCNWEEILNWECCPSAFSVVHCLSHDWVPISWDVIETWIWGWNNATVDLILLRTEPQLLFCVAKFYFSFAYIHTRRFCNTKQSKISCKLVERILDFCLEFLLLCNVFPTLQVFEFNARDIFSPVTLNIAFGNCSSKELN